MSIFNDPEVDVANIILDVRMPAHLIPDGAHVTKLTGRVVYTLKHKLVLYQEDKSTPVTIEGTFLVSDTARINQIDRNTDLMWSVSTGWLYNELSDILAPDDDK